jgi:hypothetical protein
MPSTFTIPDAAEPSNRYSPEAMAAERAARDARRFELVAAATALGFADVAGHFATALTTYANAPSFGLQGYDDQFLASRIRAAISAYQVALTTAPAATVREVA